MDPGLVKVPSGLSVRWPEADRSLVRVESGLSDRGLHGHPLLQKEGRPRGAPPFLADVELIELMLDRHADSARCFGWERVGSRSTVIGDEQECSLLGSVFPLAESHAAYDTGHVEAGCLTPDLPARFWHSNHLQPCERIGMVGNPLATGFPTFAWRLRLRRTGAVLGERLASLSRNLRGNNPRGILGRCLAGVLLAEPSAQHLRVDAEFGSELLGGVGLCLGSHSVTSFRMPRWFVRVRVIVVHDHIRSIYDAVAAVNGVHRRLQNVYKPQSAESKSGLSVRGPSQPQPLLSGADAVKEVGAQVEEQGRGEDHGVGNEVEGSGEGHEVDEVRDERHAILSCSMFTMCATRERRTHRYDALGALERFASGVRCLRVNRPRSVLRVRCPSVMLPQPAAQRLRRHAQLVRQISRRDCLRHVFTPFRVFDVHDVMIVHDDDANACSEFVNGV